MKRLGAILLLLALFVTGCVQEYPYELEDAFSEQASSPSPGIVQNTPAISCTPKASPAVSAAPKATPVLPSPSPEETARPTPAPSSPAEKEQAWPAAEERLYLDEASGAASPVYRFEGSSYTEQDIRMLAILLRMGQWRSLNGLIQAFQSAITPDIRLCDFIEEDAITPCVTVNGPVMIEAHSVAYIELICADQTAYLLLFKELEDGVFQPLSLVKVDDAGGLAMPYALQEAGEGELFLIADIREQYSPPYSYFSYDRLMENWYDLADGQKKLSIALTCSMEQNVPGVYRRIQLYEAQFDREKANKAGQGIYLEFNQKLQFHVVPEGGQSFVLQNATPCRLYFDMQERRFFTDTPEALFYAGSGYMEEWQYKHVFQEEFTSMQTQMADPFLQEFANAVFGVGDPAEEAPYIPEEEQREYLQQESARSLRISPYDTGAQTERTLIALQNDINGMRYQGLADTLLRYGRLRAESYDGEEGQPFDVLWSKVEDVRCFLDFTTAKERQAYLELRYRQNREYKGILIVFEPDGDTWVQSGAYQYTYAGSRGDLPAIAYAQGDLFITIPAGRKNGQMGWETLVVRNGKPLLYYVSDYRDDSGITYKTGFLAQGDERGALQVAAYLDGVEQAIFKWQVKLWVKDGGVFAEQGISKLAYGNADDHPELRGALLTTLKALAEDKTFTARSEARRCLRKLR